MSTHDAPSLTPDGMTRPPATMSGFGIIRGLAAGAEQFRLLRDADKFFGGDIIGARKARDREKLLWLKALEVKAIDEIPF